MTDRTDEKSRGKFEGELRGEDAGFGVLAFGALGFADDDRALLPWAVGPELHEDLVVLELERAAEVAAAGDDVAEGDLFAGLDPLLGDAGEGDERAVVLVDEHREDGVEEVGADPGVGHVADELGGEGVVPDD